MPGRPNAASASGSGLRLKGAWIKEQKVVVTDGKITAFRVNMLVTFVLGGDTSI